MRWHLEPDASEIGKRWTLNLVTALWGEHPEALSWYERQSFSDRCGQRMQKPLG